jgi:hypothetical protein
MKSISASRASTAVAVVAAIVAVLAVMFPGLGFGQPIFGHGGTPTDVYTQTLGSPNDEECAVIPVDGNDIMRQEFEVAVPSLVVAVASFDWEGLGDREIGVTHLELDGPFGSPHPGDTWFTALAPTIEVANTTLSWSWANVMPGQTHTVGVFAAVQTFPNRGRGEDLFAVAQDCSLTVFVSPMAP